MSRSGLAHRIAWVMAVALLAAGCGGDPTPSADQPSESETFDPSPTPEGSGSETPLPPVDDVSISVPTLPIGGNTDVDGVSQCGHANWLASEIPPGVEVRITGVALDPEGVFGLEGDACGSDVTACADSWTWASDNQDQECTVSVTQQVDSDASATLVLAGTVTCTSQEVCDEFEGSDGLFDGSQIEFFAELGLVLPSPSDSPSESTGEESPAVVTESDPASDSTTSTEE